MIDLILTHEDREIYRSVLAPGEYVIGRDPEVEILANVPDLSRRHARLLFGDNDLWIEDLGSINGTWVDEQPVNGRVSIAGRSSVRLGDVSLEIRGDLTAGGSPMSLAGDVPQVPRELSAVNRYVIGGLVAHGGMGNILDAHQTGMRREVAMKVIRGSAGTGGLRRFINEARITGELEHPNIVPVHELGVDADGQVFYTMKFVRGHTLAEVITMLAGDAKNAAEKYPLPALLTIFQKVCDAIAFAHNRGVIHRDLKPANIMLGDFGEVLVMDWGLAKRRGASADGTEAEDEDPLAISGNTVAGALLGTPRYMAPEQARGEVSSLDERSDIYALGTILHEILYLRPVISGHDNVAVIEKVAKGIRDKLSKDWRSPHLPGGKVPVSLRAVRHKALAFEPSARYPSVGELQADLSAYQAGFATGAEGAGLVTQLALLVKRHRGIFNSIGLGLALLAGVIIVYTWKLVLATERATQAVAMKEIQRKRAEGALASVEAEKIRADNQRDKAETALAVAQAENQRANAERAKTVAAIGRTEVMEKGTETALAALKNAAPILLVVAESYQRAGRTKDADLYYNLAIEADPASASIHRARANAFQTSKRLPQAIAGYRRSLELEADEQTRRNLELSMSLQEKNGGAAELKPELVRQLAEELEAQGRTLEAALLTGRLSSDPDTLPPLPLPVAAASHEPDGPSPSYSVAELALYHKLKAYTSQPSWSSGRISSLPVGGFRLDLSGLQIGDLAELKDVEVTELSLASSNFRNLATLDGLPLRSLSIHSTRVSDLSPLRGRPLLSLNASHLSVTSIVPLENMPLESLHISGLRLEKLKPLRSLPLKKLFISGANLENLLDLKGLQLDELDVSNNPFTSLAPLREMPLRILRLNGCDKIKDFSGLLAFLGLQDLSLPAHASELDFLTRLPVLQMVSHERITSGGGMVKTDFLELSKQSDTSWQSMKATLALTDAKDLRPDRVTAVGGGLVFLDLRGTEITQLGPLEGLPVGRLAIDTPDAVLDLTPLRGMPLTHLDLAESGISSVEPLMSCEKLEALAVPFQVSDIARLKDHPSLHHLGYETQSGGGRPAATVSEFFAMRTDDADWPTPPRPEEVAVERFDDPGKGMSGWEVVMEEVERERPEIAAAERKPARALLSGWKADPVPNQGRGGGQLAIAAESEGKKAAYFSAPASFLGDRSALIGGCLEFQLRQLNTVGLFDAPDVEIRSGNLRLVCSLPGPPTSRWQTFTVPFDASAWKIGTLDGRTPAPREFEKAMAKVDRLLIRAEFSEQAKERTELDDLRIWAPTVAKERVEKSRNGWPSLETWRVFADIVTAETGGAVPPHVDFTYLKHETWIRAFEKHQGVVLLHPLDAEKPAFVRYRILNPVDEGSRMTLALRGPDVQPGVRIKVIHKRKVLATELLDATWRNLQVSLPRMEGGKDEIMIEVWADQWDREYCYLDEIRVDPPPAP